jgi:hypothetical protein
MPARLVVETGRVFARQAQPVRDTRLDRKISGAVDRRE